MLEVVRVIMEEGKAMSAKDFFFGGDLDIELKFEGESEDFQGLDSNAGGLNAVKVARTRSPARTTRWLQ